MKVYMFIAHMGVGGAERVCVSLANEFHRLGNEVHIVVLDLKNDVNTQLLDEGISVHPLGVSRLRYAFFPMLSFVRKEKPESMLVFGNEMGILLNTMRRLHLIQLRIVLRVLNNVNISLDKAEHVSKTVENYLKKQQKQLKDMEEVVAQCDGMRQMLLERGLVTESQVHTIYNPVSEKIVQATEKAKAERSSDYTFTFIGRIDPQKNVGDLLESFAIVHEKREHARLLIVGDGILTEEMKEKAKALGIESHVSFLGLRKDMENIYAASDAVVLTSKYEGMPNCLIEAIACGIPVVSYDCPIGPREIVVDDKNGYLVPFMDKEAMAEEMILCINKPWERSQIKESAKKFDVHAIAPKYLELLRK